MNDAVCQPGERTEQDESERENVNEETWKCVNVVAKPHATTEKSDAPRNRDSEKGHASVSQMREEDGGRQRG